MTQAAQGIPEGLDQRRCGTADNEADAANTATLVLGCPERDWKRTAQPAHVLQESPPIGRELHHNVSPLCFPSLLRELGSTVISVPQRAAPPAADRARIPFARRRSASGRRASPRR